jgi:nucleoside-diphosphate-sugar epimerase
VTLLVTGASGFIGRRAIAKLARDSVFDIVTAGRGETVQGCSRHVSVDLLESGAAADLVRRLRPSHLLHLAWNAEPGKFWSARDNLEWSAVTLQMVRAFLDAGGARAVLAGTCAEYDWTTAGRLTEDAPLNPATLYGAAKDATRRATCAAGAAASVPIAWGRVFWLYGPGEARGRLVSDVARALLEGRTVETSEGRQRRDFLHVDDVAAAFVAAIMSNHHGPFNIGSGQAVPVRDIVEILANAAGKPDLVRFGARATSPNEPPLIEADTTILLHTIGFKPKVSLARGLAETLASWRTEEQHFD